MRYTIKNHSFAAVSFWRWVGLQLNCILDMGGSDHGFGTSHTAEKELFGYFLEGQSNIFCSFGWCL